MKKLYIDTVRGPSFSTNSSSVHTPLILKGHGLHDYVESNYFGWESFICASKEAKQKYFLAQVASSRVSDIAKIVKEVDPNFPDDLIETTKESDEDDYDRGVGVDHQSQWYLPKNGEELDITFLKELYEWLLGDDIVVLGGNDNGGPGPSDHIEEHGGELAKVVKLENLHGYTQRKDPKGFWTFFNKDDGKLVRFAFKDVDMSKSTTPELVDLKITNQCDKGCSYCYQNSVPNGKEGDIENIKKVIEALGKLQIFEVAIGGGEPTTYPFFWEILKLFKGAGITPNFTTRNLEWLKDPELVKTFIECGGGFAYSVDDVNQVTDLLEAVMKADLRKHMGRISVHYVVRDDAWTLKRVLSACSRYFSCTLLGYKEVGRGKVKNTSSLFRAFHSVIDNKELGEILSKTDCQINVDTQFIHLHKEALSIAAKLCGYKSTDVPYNIKIREGAHSMYIDAVTMEMASSSYGIEKRVKIDQRKDIAKQITEAFKGY